MTSNDTKSDTLKYALCYVPFLAFIFFFTESNKSDKLMKHIKYGSTIFIVYIILNMIIGVVLSWFLSLLYIWIATFLGYKVYNGEEVELEHVDKLEKKIKESFNDIKK